MTHNEWESGKRLTTNNATREQLVWMVKDRESIINRQQEQIDRLQKQLERWQAFCVDLVNHEAKPIKMEMPDSLKQTCDYLSAWTE